MSLGAQQGQFSGEDELNAALAQPGLSSVEKQFFMTDGVARYSFVLTYDNAASDSRSPSRWGAGRESRATGGKGAKPSRRYPSQAEVVAAIPPERRGLYDLLREVRNKTAEKLGKKGYLLANNYQLAHVVCKAPQTMGELRAIRDLGDEFCTICGEAVLENVKGMDPVELNAPEGAWWAEDTVGRDAPIAPDSKVGRDAPIAPDSPDFEEVAE